MPLSEDEQRMLQQMESHLHESDPHLAKFGKDTLYAHCLRQMKWATVTFLAGTTVLVVTLATATTFVVAFIGFMIMLAATLWFEHALAKLGRAGLQHLAQSLRASGLRDQFGTTRPRSRSQFRRDG